MFFETLASNANCLNTRLC